MRQHAQIKKKLKIAGFALFFVGIVCAITGFTDFFLSFQKEKMPSLFFLCFIGLPLFAVGLSLLILGFQREIETYAKNETVPVLNEAGKEITPAVQAISSAVRGREEPVVCAQCGASNSARNNFCVKCGSPLTCVCPNCKTAQSSASEFCGNCGQKLKP